MNTFSILLKKIILFFLLFIITLSAYSKDAAKYTISGYIKDNSNGEVLIGAIVTIKELTTGTSANLYGYYSISIPEGKYTLIYSFLGFKGYTQNIELNKNQTINVELEPSQTLMKEIKITEKKADDNIKKTDSNCE